MRALTKLLQIAACLLGLVVVLTVPISTAHRFQVHFRSPEVRRTFQGHIYFAQPEVRAADALAPASLQPMLAPVRQAWSTDQPLRPATDVPQVPLLRLLQHLKLGRARSDSPDPLL